MSFVPGDEVVCVDDHRLKDVLREGQHYVIRWSGPSVHPIVGGYAGVRLAGIERIMTAADAMDDPPFRAERFRPVKRESIEIFREMCVSKNHF
jgi:hypothetical protein